MFRLRRIPIGAVILLCFAALLAPLPAQAQPRPPTTGDKYDISPRGTGQAGLTCGRATFDWYSQQGQTSVEKNEDVCVWLLGNEMAQDILRIGLGGWPTDRYAQALVGDLHDGLVEDLVLEAVEDGAEKKLDEIVVGMFPYLRKFARIKSGTDIAITVSDWVGRWLIEKAIREQINEKKACIAFIEDTNDDGTKNLTFNMVYNPALGPGGDYPTGVKVWDREARRFKDDKYHERQLGMRCTDQGLVSVSKTSPGVLSDNSQAVFSLPPPPPPPPPVAPTPPQGVAAVSNNPGEASVSWTAPANSGSHQLVGYYVTTDPWAREAEGTVPAGLATTATVTGLTPGETYTFTVFAVSLAAESTPSLPSAPVLIKGSLPPPTTTPPPTTPPPTTPPIGTVGPIAVAAGAVHTCALLTDGTARCWGRNGVGQLGNGTITPYDAYPQANPSPVAVTGLSGATAITAGLDHTCALLGQGTVRCWGLYDGGQGSGRISTPTPVDVPGLSGVIAIAAGPSHTCALLGNGTARCWGDNTWGQLGDGSATNSTTPVAVTGLSDATAITVGDSHACALLGNGTARCWGTNGLGQLGDGSATNSSTPVAVAGLSGATAITAGKAFTCAILGDGTARCWGSHDYGQLGIGGELVIGIGFGASSTPVAVTGLSGATAITAGDSHACALLRDGTARCWGFYDPFAQPANYRGTSTPVAVTGLSGATAITAGRAFIHHTCAILGDGTAASCWGFNGYGQLGNDIGIGTMGAFSTTPVAVMGLIAA